MLLEYILDCEMSTFDTLVLILRLLSWICPSSSRCHLCVPCTLWCTWCGMLHCWFIRDTSFDKGLLDLTDRLRPSRCIRYLYWWREWKLSFRLTEIVDSHLHMFTKEVRSYFPTEEFLSNTLLFKFVNILAHNFAYHFLFEFLAKTHLYGCWKACTADWLGPCLMSLFYFVFLFVCFVVLYDVLLVYYLPVQCWEALLLDGHVTEEILSLNLFVKDLHKLYDSQILVRLIEVFRYSLHTRVDLPKSNSFTNSHLWFCLCHYIVLLQAWFVLYDK